MFVSNLAVFFPPNHMKVAPVWKGCTQKYSLSVFLATTRITNRGFENKVQVTAVAAASTSRLLTSLFWVFPSKQWSSSSSSRSMATRLYSLSRTGSPVIISFDMLPTCLLCFTKQSPSKSRRIADSQHVKDVLFDPECNLGCLLCACQIYWSDSEMVHPVSSLSSCSLSCYCSNSILHESILVRTVHKPRTEMEKRNEIAQTQV